MLIYIHSWYAYRQVNPVPSTTVLVDIDPVTYEYCKHTPSIPLIPVQYMLLEVHLSILRTVVF